MKRSILATAALLSSTIMSWPALAVPSPATDSAAPTPFDMQTVCNTYIEGMDPAVFRVNVVNPNSTATDPAPIEGTEEQINYRADTGSTFSYAGFLRAEDPLSRTGGSPNMWGQAVFSQKVWDNTLYDVQMAFNHTVTYTWSCQTQELVTTTVHVGGNEGGGSGNNGQNNGLNEQNGGNGNGNNGCGNGNGGPNGTNENCGGHDVTHSDWVDRDSYDESLTNTVADGKDTTETGLQLAGHVEGVNYTEYGTYRPDGIRALACISPGKKGGSWTPKNGYTGGQCSTTTFNGAPTLYGTTFDSPPTNSLPAL